MDQAKSYAIITGASSGIGRAIALALANEGYHLILIARRHNLLTELSGEIKALGGNALPIVLDVTDESQVVATVQEIGSRPDGRIEVLINGAGVGSFGSVTDLTLDEFKQCLDVNLLGTFLITREVSKLMQAQRKGQIINIESIASVKGFALGGAYVASKFGIAGFSQVLWEELKEYEIKVCSIRPGLVNTSFFGDVDCADLQQALSPQDVAHTVLTVVNQSETSNISEIVLRPIKKNAQRLFYQLINEEYGHGGFDHEKDHYN